MIYLLWDCTPNKPRRSFIFWLSVINRLQSYNIHKSEIEKLKSDGKLAGALMERDFPVSFNVITSHLLLHESETMERMGNMYSRWMYPFERLNSVILRHVKSKKHPEASAIRTIRVSN